MNKLVFGNIEVSKKEFDGGKKGIKLSNVDVGKIVVSNKVKGNNEIIKYFIGYIDDFANPLCLILPQMSAWIKCFENSGKNISFKIEDDEMYLKYNEIWNKIKELLNGVKLSSDVIYDDHYIKTKVKTFSEVIKTMFDRDKIPEERIEYTCVPCISIDSVLKIEKISTSLFRTTLCKYKVKKREKKNLIDYGIDLDSDYERD